MALLLREALGDSLRRVRVSQSRTLREVSSLARVSLGYLSEVERGRKEASSELLASICDALDVELADVLFDVSSLLADGVATRSGDPVGASQGRASGSSAADGGDRSRSRMVIPQEAGTEGMADTQTPEKAPAGALVAA
ncbi:helix-turn-helix domain-containing protein [Hoyosella altamirensis]|uniref:Transcriptional regulator with XRE-family HTH domain n=1 Tax=Hoyosella altamirensis TaxID=616997 RepID=A0A839RQW7_9ACTN|nr:helix-turn-helix transcriptional regulator [Hoyosella altamirensis]MBB3038504.1 transcriptional regulator with XRE-family HTH domain [Hoyosella altamirensis]